MKLQFLNFGGQAPRIDPTLLGPNQAQLAQNCDLRSGNLRPLNGLTAITTLPDSSRLTIFPYNGGWLSWTTDVDVVRGPLAEDQYQRIYYTGDGVPKVRGVEGGVEVEYDLGIPAPTNTLGCAAQAKSATTWTREWHYFYEEPDGTVSQSGTLSEGVGATDVQEITPGSVYQVDTIPAKTTASADAVFVLWFKALAASGALLGYLYPNISQYESNTDFYLDGAVASGAQVNSTSTPEAQLTLSYDTSRSSDYEVDRYYVYTFVSHWGEEGPPSPVSSLVSVDPTQDCNLTNFDVAVTGDYNIEKIRIYRTVSTDAGTAYQRVDEIALGTASYLDTKTDGDCGTIMPSADWDAPPTTLAGLVMMPGAFAAGFVGRTVYFCEPNQIHAWKPDYAYNVDYDIVGLGVSQNSLIVVTKGTPFVMTGSHPNDMVVAEIKLPQACVSKRGIVSMPGGVIYPSPDGLVAIQGGAAILATELLYTKKQWESLSPSTMRADVHDNQYHGFTDNAGLILDFRGGSPLLTTTDETADGLHADLETDTLYIIQGADIKSWDTDAANPLTATWRGKKWHFGRRSSPVVCRVVAEAYPIVLKTYSNGDTLVSTLSLPTEVARKYPTLRDEKDWFFEVVSNKNVRELTISSSMSDL